MQMRSLRLNAALAVTLTFALVAPQFTRAQVAAPASPAAAAAAAAPEYSFREAMIPTRDGVKLHTVIFAPKDQQGPLPFIFIRTPYGVPGQNFPIARAYAELAAERYIFALQDIRGRYQSEGQFVMQRPPRRRSSSRGAKRGARSPRGRPRKL